MWSRCLVVYGTRHYFTSKNCLRELLSALLFREGGRAQNIALLLDEGKCDNAKCTGKCDNAKKVEKCEAFEKSGKNLDEICARLEEGWDVKVFRDLPAFWKWVGARGGAGDVQPLLQWYKEVNGRPRALQLTDRLSNLVHTEPMFKTGLCVRGACCDVMVRRPLFWCCQRQSWASTRCWRTASCQRINSTVRFGHLLHGDELSLLEMFNAKEWLFLCAVLAFVVALAFDLYYSPPQHLSIASGSSIGAFIFLISTFDVFSLLICILVLLPSAAVACHQTRPSTNYSNFLEPLVIAAHSSSTLSLSTAKHFTIYLVSSAIPDNCRKARVYNNLLFFLKDMGLSVELSLLEFKGLNKSGLSVWFLSKGEVAKYLPSDDYTIPVLFDEECTNEGTSMGARLYVKAYHTPPGMDDDERCREIGADIIQALSKRAASALLRSVV